jgi:GxxExxY protein
VVKTQRSAERAVLRESHSAGMNSYEYKQVTDGIIGAAIEVHKTLGPGLLESAYCECLAREFLLRNIPFQRQVPVPVVYKGVHLECGYRLDFLVGDSVVVEIKSVDGMPPIYESQLVTYLSLGGWTVGLLINFNVLLLKDGIRRRVLNFQD